MGRTMSCRAKISIAVVEFDLTVGQVCRCLVPEDALDDKEKKDLAYHAFPDSKSVELTLSSGNNSIHDTLFHFRIKNRREAGEWRYAYAFCRQRHDPSLPRGGDQISVVVVSNTPMATTLMQITKFAGEVYFAKGQEALAQVVDSVDAWGRDEEEGGVVECELEVPGEGEGEGEENGNGRQASAAWKHMSSSRGGKQLTVRADEFVAPIIFPERRASTLDAKEGQEESQTDAQTRMSFSKVCTYSCLSGVVKHLWRIWEAMLLAEPFVIFGSNPEIVSSSVSACMDLIFPLPYSADYRPYFTIHDSEFNEIQNPENCGAEGNPTLIGVTNTYFLKAYSSWPNILSVGGGDAAGGLAYNSPMSSPRSPRRGSLKSWFSFRSEDRSNLINVVDSYTQELYAMGPGLVKESYKILGSLDLTPDDASEMQWVTSATINTKILKKHFQELTETFLAQIDPYAKGLYDVEGGNEEILTCLSTQASFPPVLTQSMDRTKLLQLYEKFLNSPNCDPWFKSRSL
ncbi:guanine nucleotide exchange factor DENND6 [Chloropicon primus]|uniref:Guanine nucleotide exchange factor DENND6 n=2 Tax=Chloropicon primus TaxID=1764295 RepID=A0A5B8MCU2_9CHLO|nr:guanine nucleotide exchange factor DENND6 [Chloropicon primus]|eukprot:QDZ18249.1 guanine nucleotide exchange factor DENND6 [Chloropicon primus]